MDNLNDFEIWMREYREALIDTQRFFPTATVTAHIKSVEGALELAAAYREATAEGGQ